MIRNMIELVEELMTTPGAEDEPEPWLTRLISHFGLGIIVMVLVQQLVLLLTWGHVSNIGFSVVLVGCGYAMIEAKQWAMSPFKSSALAWDCVLDWVGVMCGPLMIWAALHGDNRLMVSTALTVLTIGMAGVARRR